MRQFTFREMLDLIAQIVVNKNLAFVCEKNNNILQVYCRNPNVAFTDNLFQSHPIMFWKEQIVDLSTTNGLHLIHNAFLCNMTHFHAVTAKLETDYFQISYFLKRAADILDKDNCDYLFARIMFHIGCKSSEELYQAITQHFYRDLHETSTEVRRPNPYISRRQT